ncbi:MAG: CpsD/CapB family tyrosine-protein kinase [Proteobacteria bacterium]|nr:CpsD/CapB family tyrosine-protein kinase [Pseudomonadota bacterium]
MIHDALKRAGHNLHAIPSPLPTPADVPPAPAMPVAPPVTTLPRSAARRRAPWPEMVALYYNIDALRTSDSPVVLQFVASRPGEGTSTVARAFASFAAGEDTSSVLLIDASCHGAQPRPAFGRAPPPSLVEIARAGDRIEAAIEPGRTPDLHEARLADHANSLLHTNGTAWTSVLEQARQRYRFTIVDSPAVSTNPDTVVLSRGCDGVVLVIEAESTRGPVVQATIETIERFGGKVLGTVLNKRRLYIPRWIYRRL